MTKWKGVVASIAPMVGVVATTGFLTTPAQADNECGSSAVVVVCDSSTYTTGPNDDIRYTDVDGSIRLELQGPDLSVETPGTAVLVNSDATSDGSVVVTVEDFDNIATSTDDSTAVFVENKGSGEASSKLSGGLVQTAGSKSHGLWSYISNPSSMQNTKAQLSFGEIGTSQNESHGLYSLNDGGGEAVAEKEAGAGGSGIVTTLGEEAYGLYAHISNIGSEGTSTVSFRQGNVTTEGARSHGLFSRNDGEGNTAVSLSSGGEVTTKSTEAHGALAHNTNNTSTGRTEVQLTSASIKTEGDRSIGLKALADGFGGAVVNVASGTVSTLGEMAHGVLAEITNTESEADASAHIRGGSITTAGKEAIGLSAENAGSGQALVEMTNQSASITTSGDKAHGLYANNSGTGQANAKITGGEVKTTNTGSHGGFASISNALSSAVARTEMTGGSVVTEAADSFGLYAVNKGLGEAQIALSGGSVSTGGERADGVFSSIENNASEAQSVATIGAGSIVTTTGDGATGIYASTNGLGSTHATIGGGTVTTDGQNAHGASSSIDNRASEASSTVTISGDGKVTTKANDAVGLYATTNGTGAATVKIEGGTVTTSGDSAAGVRAYNDISGTSVVTMDGGEIESTGIDSDGIHASSGGAGTYDVDVNGGTIKSGSGKAVGINVRSSTGGTIKIGSDATINSAASGLAIVDGDLGRDGIGERVSEAEVTTSGTVTGDTVLGFGNDSFELRGGIYTGNIYGDSWDNQAQAEDGNDAFKWTGGELNSGFYGTNGSDTATISTGARYDGNEVMDGGDDLDVADGWIDTLRIEGQTVTIIGANIRNWENIIFDGGSIAFSDNALSTGSSAGNGLTITGNGLVDGGNAFALTGNLTVDGGSTFEGTGAGAGVYSISGNLTNNGTVTTQDGAVGDVITIGGNYTGV